MDYSKLKTYLCNDGIYYSSISLDKYYTFKIIFKILLEHPEFIKYYEDNIKWRHWRAKYIWDTAYYIFGDKKHKISQENINSFISDNSVNDLYLYFDSLLLNPNLRSFLCELSQDLFDGIIEKKLYYESADNFEDFEKEELIELVDYFSMKNSTDETIFKDKIT